MGCPQGRLWGQEPGRGPRPLDGCGNEPWPPAREGRLWLPGLCLENKLLNNSGIQTSRIPARFRAKGPERFWERILGPKTPFLYGVGDLGDAQGVPVGIGDPPRERVGGSSLTPTSGGIYGIAGGCGGAGTPLISGHQMKRFVRAELVNELVKGPDRCGQSGHPGRNPTAPWQGAGVGCWGGYGAANPTAGVPQPP